MNHLYLRIVKSGLIVGTLDILSAFLYYYIKTGNQNVTEILKYITSGIMGDAAFNGDTLIVLSGLALHYFIAFAFTVFFYLVYPKLKLNTQPIVFLGIVYGLFVWIIMNLIVVPLSNIPSRPFNLGNALVNAAILIVCIGLPLSWMAHTFYNTAKK